MAPLVTVDFATGSSNIDGAHFPSNDKNMYCLQILLSTFKKRGMHLSRFPAFKHPKCQNGVIKI